MNISLAIDIVFIAILLFCVIKYGIKGLVKSVMDIFKTLLAVVLAYVLRVPVSKLIDSAFMNKAVVGWVQKSLVYTKTGEGSGTNLVDFYENTPSVFVTFLEKFGLDKPMVEGGLANISETDGSVMETLANNIGSSVSALLSLVLAMILVFFIAIIIFTVIAHVFDLLTRFAFINGVNKILGALYGGLVAFIIMWVLSALIFIVINVFGGIAPDVINRDIVNNSVILKFFGEYNFIEIIGETFAPNRIS